MNYAPPAGNRAAAIRAIRESRKKNNPLILERFFNREEHLSDYDPSRKPIANAVRHLAYHVYPYADRWRWNIEQLKQRAEIFNGERWVGIATGPGTASVEQVKEAFGDFTTNYICVENDPNERELTTHFKLLEKCFRHRGESDITFRAHTKGTTYPLPRSSLWAELLYKANLDYPALVDNIMAGFECAGSFKRHGVFFRGASQWHYGGSFYWLRNSYFAARNWRKVDPNIHPSVMVEPYPSLHVDEHRAGILFMEGPDDVAHLYNDNKAYIGEKFKAWQPQHRWLHRGVPRFGSKMRLHILMPSIRPAQASTCVKAYLCDMTPHPFELRVHIAQQNQEPDPKGQRKINELLDMIPPSSNDWLAMFADDTTHEPVLFKRLAEAIASRKDIRAVMFSEYDSPTKIREATPENVRSGSCSGGQFFIRRDLIADRRFDYETVGDHCDSAMMERLYAEHPDEFAFVQEPLMRYNSFQWPK